ncbi:MAG: SEC-C domain-containing protein [Elusimicrobia bacterium]|nr:SEC-C domain-containing protein [Elusimicrobiota bacterium]
MSWFKSLLKPFSKPESPAEEKPAEPKAPEAAAPPKAAKPPEPKAPEDKGLMSFFYRKWKDPAFLKQIQILAAHMAREGVDIKDQGQVKAWLEKNKAAIEAGKFKEAPLGGAKPQTFEKTEPEVGRNEPCPCGSGKKFKKCCGLKGPAAPRG